VTATFASRPLSLNQVARYGGKMITAQFQKRAIVTGAKGRLGRAFTLRLKRDGFEVEAIDVGETHRGHAPGYQPYLFDCAYHHDEPDQHVERVTGHLREWHRYAAIFVPSSMWIDHDHAYGRAKRKVEQLAAQYTLQGARIVTDRIGYFPGDGVEPDPSEPMYAHRVTGDALYARVMQRMRAVA
jgi:nucleoside-diphosphate-sugar epimerase